MGEKYQGPVCQERKAWWTDLEDGTMCRQKSSTVRPLGLATPLALSPPVPFDADRDLISGFKPNLKTDFESVFEKIKTEYLDEGYAKLNQARAKIGRQVLPREKYDTINQDVVDLHAADLIMNSVAKADSWLAIAINRIKPLYARIESTRRNPQRTLGSIIIPKMIKKALKQHFRSQSDREMHMAIVTIYPMLKKLKNDPKGVASTSLNYQMGGAWCSGSTVGYVSKLFPNDIVVCPYLLTDHLFASPHSETTYTELALFLIHEAVHRLLAWHVRTDVYADSRGYKKLNLKTALENPDSYAHFVQVVGTPNEGL